MELREFWLQSKHTTQFRMDRAGLKNREIRVRAVFKSSEEIQPYDTISDSFQVFKSSGCNASIRHHSRKSREQSLTQLDSATLKYSSGAATRTTVRKPQQTLQLKSFSCLKGQNILRWLQKPVRVAGHHGWTETVPTAIYFFGSSLQPAA